MLVNARQDDLPPAKPIAVRPIDPAREPHQRRLNLPFTSARRSVPAVDLHQDQSEFIPLVCLRGAAKEVVMQRALYVIVLAVVASIAVAGASNAAPIAPLSAAAAGNVVQSHYYYRHWHYGPWHRHYYNRYYGYHHYHYYW